MAQASKALPPLDRGVAVPPNNENFVSKALALIHRIDRIEVPAVVKHRGHTFYSVGIFFKSQQSNLPTNSSFVHRNSIDEPPSKPKKRTPNVVLYRRFCEFGRLRESLHYHALVGYELCSCSLCSNMLKLLEHGQAMPRLRVKLFSDAVTTCRVLETFLNALVRLVVDTTTPSTRRLRSCCDNKVRMPLILFKFLLDVGEHDAKAKHARRPLPIWTA